MNNQELNALLRARDARVLDAIDRETRQVSGFGDALALNTLRKKADRLGITGPKKNGTLRLSVIGGCNLHPLADFVEHFARTNGGFDCVTWTGDYDNYVAEIMDEGSELYKSRPDVVFLIPSEQRCYYRGNLSGSKSNQEEQGKSVVSELLDLCERVHQNSGAEVVLANFRLPAHFDPGPLRHRSLGSDYAFRKFVNLRLGFDAPNYVHVCDVEFLSNRTGNLQGLDARSWFESKQPYAADLMVQVAREVGVVLAHLKSGPKKLLVLDLDNTLWGGVVGDDGLEGIEIGTTSPRGEAFRAFQKSLVSLKERGILLAVCSKNDYEKAIEPFERHPEMILRMKDIVCFKANWEPKSDNIREIAQAVNLGLDSFVFVDDNPAEIEIVRQFLPQVSTICLGDDPSEFVGKLQDSRFFEMRSVTSEDVERAELYKQETERQVLLSKSTDMNSYLESLAMQGFLSEFVSTDVPRITQLINKSNQFNLTTRRRTESEVQTTMQRQDFVTLAMRLSDKFGEHGLISIVIGRVSGKDMELDTWLMSCRVLKRQVEEEVLNEVVRLAELKGCERLVGTYIPTEKNGMVHDLYPRLGFERDERVGDNLVFTLSVADYRPKDTKIAISSRAYGSVAGYSRVANGI